MKSQSYCFLALLQIDRIQLQLTKWPFLLIEIGIILFSKSQIKLLKY